jgi:ASC-1-like (ASCH) protein/GNAT superfamily N-acetyltransferase
MHAFSVPAGIAEAAPAEDLPTVLRATEADAAYIVDAFAHALAPYYGGDHIAHADRLIRTHLGGGSDPRGLLSTRQLLLILWAGGVRRGVLNLVFKQQGTCKISPLILHPAGHRAMGLGATLLQAAVGEAVNAGARQMYCTVTERNTDALQFFLQFGFVVCGRSDGQYKDGETEVLLRRPLPGAAGSPESVISVTEVVTTAEWHEVRCLLLSRLRHLVDGVHAGWLDSLRRGSEVVPGAGPRPASGAVAWVYCARDRAGRCRGAAIINSKKGRSLKVMPIVAVDLDAFRALAIDLSALLADKGRKAYLHHSPGPGETAVLQESGWHLEAEIPGAYIDDVVTQQWGRTLTGKGAARSLRIQDRYLSLIESGRKTLEIRVGYEHIKRITRGDLIRFQSGPRSLTRRVVDVRRYENFEAMIRHEDIGRALPGLAPTRALARLKEIYPPDKEELGIVVIEVADWVEC